MSSHYVQTSGGVDLDMGFRFRKQIKLGGGIRLNVGKSGVGVSGGVKGFRVSHGADGKTRVTASIPGTGISYQEILKDERPKLDNKGEVTNNLKKVENSDKPYLIVYGEYYGSYFDGVLDDFKDINHHHCSVHFYDDRVCVVVQGIEREKIYISTEKICIEMKRVEKRGLFSSSTYPLLIISESDELGSKELHLKMNDFDMIFGISSTIKDRKEFVKRNKDIYRIENDYEINVNSDENALFGQYHSIFEVDDDHIAAVVTIEGGSIHKGDMVFLGKIDDGELNCFSATVSAIVSQEIELEWTDSEDGVVVIFLEVGLDFVAEYVGEGLISDSVDGFLT